jgi:hypothetical protein
MFNATDWDLTSLGGTTISMGTGLGPLSLGGGKVPMEFTNKTTKAVKTFAGYGVGGSVVAKAGLLSKLWKRAPGGSFSPSSFPSAGKIYALQLARMPFDIEQIRYHFGALVDVGFDLIASRSAGLMVFSYIPTGPLLPILSPLGMAAAAIAVCPFYTTGLVAGGWGPSGSQFDFHVS